MPYVAQHRPERCTRCGACFEIVACPGAEREICIGCGACTLACPNEAIEMVKEVRTGKVKIEVDGKQATVSERISVKGALRELGYEFADLPVESGVFAPCNVGGCGSCMVEIDDTLRPSCVTEARDGMKISTGASTDEAPRRIVENFLGHPVGGVGTPWNIKKNPAVVIEIICFAGGCNFRCPQCQNWKIAYRGKGSIRTPKEAARTVSTMRTEAGVDRMGISGGESTLNRPWLVEFITELKRLNPDGNARFHVDTNGSLLTKDYIDELVDAGMTDIGIDLKSLNTDTFLRITGLKDRKKARKYKEVAWKAVEYLTQSYKEKAFLGIGIPYNSDLISIEEIKSIGKKIYEINPSVQVCVNNYVPEFRSRISRPTYQEMRLVHNILKAAKLKTVICQTTGGFIGP